MFCFLIIYIPYINGPSQYWIDARQEVIKMESLPLDMVIEISKYLTPRDLASCIAVSCRWHDIFNEGRLWKPHCNPSLKEPLDKTPCIVKPKFVSPESSSTTLTPISCWRLAFLKEHHLWGNWKKRYFLRNYIYLEEMQLDLLSDTLVVRWFPNRIEIWSIRDNPTTFIASRHLEGLGYSRVYSTNGLLVKHKDSVKIFHVDPSKNDVIELVHDIFVDSHEPCDVDEMEILNCVNGSTYVHVNANGLSLDLIDLEKGMKIKTESCPVMRKYNQNATIVGIKSSVNSDGVIVIVHVPWSRIGEEYHCYIYSLGQLTFYSGPIVKYFWNDLNRFAINGDYLAVSDLHSLKIYNYLTSHLHFTTACNEEPVHPHVLNNSFIYIIKGSNEEEDTFGMFSLISKTSTTFCHNSLIDESTLKIINNKFVTYEIEGNDPDPVWETSGETLKRSDIPVIDGDVFNESFTRGISCYPYESCIFYYW